MIVKPTINLQPDTIHLECHLVKLAAREIRIRTRSELKIEMRLDLPYLIASVDY